MQTTHSQVEQEGQAGDRDEPQAFWDQVLWTDET